MLCKYGCGNEGKFQLKSGEWICQDSFNKCPVNRAKNSKGGLAKPKLTKRVNCIYCNESRMPWTIYKHENDCYLNPKNLRICEVCGKPIKDYKHGKTCSHICANKTFKQCGKDHWNYSGVTENHYRTICFKNHKHKCIICGENLMLDVHHYDEDHENNDPKNLVPLCPTHHRYMHTKNKYILKECVDEYVENYIKKWGDGQIGKALDLQSRN